MATRPVKVVNAEAILLEASESSYCTKNHVQFKTVKTVWERMCSFIVDALRAHKVGLRSCYGNKRYKLQSGFRRYRTVGSC